MNTQTPIDAVILWVDGGDPAHQKKMQEFIPSGVNRKSSNFRTRFDQVEEIEFAIKSILKFATFIRTVYLVTDNQIPKFLKKDPEAFKDKVKVIDHTEIFKGHEAYLPTFNCLPIESVMHRIPNLSEHFIYFNDDLFLIKPIQVEDFFKDGKPVFRGEWRRFDEQIWYKKIRNGFLNFIGKPYKKNKYGYKRGQQNIARRLGFDKKYYKFHHTPAPMVKSTIAEYFDANPEAFETNVKSRFRQKDQFAMQALVSHLHILKKKAILKKDLQLVYLGSYKKPIIWYIFVLTFAEKSKTKLFMCLQSLDLAKGNKLKFIKKWLQNKIGNESES